MRFLLAALFLVGTMGAEAPLRLGERAATGEVVAGFQGNAFSALDREVFVWVGGENSVVEQGNGWLEANLVSALQGQGKRAVVRHMGWEGDTVFRQNRMENWGSWQENLDAVGATTVFVWFGWMEALQGKSAGEFVSAYDSLLDEIAKRTKRIVILSPTPFERPGAELIADQREKNAVLREYAGGLKELARRRGFVFVDLFSPLETRAGDAAPVTRNGVHLNENGLKEIAPYFLKGLGLRGPEKISEELLGAIREKNRVWFNTWRPMNWAFAYGDRTTQPFAQGAPPDRPAFVEELKKGMPRVAQADGVIAALLSGSAPPAPLPDEPARADPPGMSAVEEKSHFKLREGFSIDLFASETNGVVRPTQIRWDERGRLWVVCAPSYPQLQPGEKPNDFILVLEDTDGDGRADKSFKWAEGLKMPMGMEFGPDGVFVCESTQLVLLKDTDGDGKADRREVIMSGFGTGDSHQDINSIRWGADGCLWFTQGYHIWSYVETPTGIVELNRSGVWRLNPRTLKLESFLNESAAGLNCWGVTFDDYGQVFHASGADFSVWHTTPALIPTLHPLDLGPGFARSRGKCTEPEFLGSSHLPEEYQGVLLKSIFFTSQIGLYRLKDDGAGYVSEDLGDLIASTGPEFRPLETRVGPDGAIYICDWFNPVIGHYQASYRDPRRDRSHGRIWRMTANGRKLLERPKLEKMSAAELIEELRSPERWNREQAKFLLYRKSQEEIARPMMEVAGHPSDRLQYGLSGVYSAHEGVDTGALRSFLGSKDFRWRAWGTRLAGLWSGRLTNALEHIEKSARDEHPRVRMEAVVAAATIPSVEALKAATAVLDSPMDASIEHALTLCIHHLAPYWRPALAAGKLDFEGRYHALARVLSTAGDTNVAGRMREMVTSGKAVGEDKEKLLAMLVESGGAEEMKMAWREAPESDRVLGAMVSVAQRRKDLADGKLVEAMLQSANGQARAAGCKLIEAWGNAFGQEERVRELARGPGRAAALGALARINAAEAAEAAAGILKEASSAEEAGAAISPFINLKNGAAVLAEAIRNVSLKPEAAKAGLLWMAQNGRDDAILLQTLRKAGQVLGAHLDYSEAAVKDLAAAAKRSGNAYVGSRIIRKPEASCLSCHRVGNEGPQLALGPDLSAVGRSLSPELIVESVFWPKRQVKEGFLLTQIVMKDGSEWAGFRASESKTELKLRGVDGSETALAKADIQRRSDAGTLMPNGLMDALTHQERLDLLRFLFDLGR